MPRVIISVLLLAVLIVTTILSAGMGVARLGRWWAHSQQQPMLKAERLKDQQRKLDAQREERHVRARMLRWIARHDLQAEIDPTYGAEAGRRANILRQELGLPLKDYASKPARPVEVVPIKRGRGRRPLPAAGCVLR
jgi:hypothetical protein